jgi:hypothetical protein
MELIGSGLFPSYDALQKSLKRHEDKSYGPKRAQMGGHSRKLRVDFDSLPKKYKQVIGDPRKSDHILENYYKVDSEMVNFYSNYQFEDGQYLTLDSQDKHITNATILQALIKLEIDRRTERMNKGGSMRGLNTTLYNDAISFIELKEEKNPDTFLCSLPRSERRLLEKAFKPFKKDGPGAIVKKYKSNDNARKVFSKDEKLLNDLFGTQEHKPHATEIARQYEAFLNGYLEIVNAKTGELYSPKGYPAISDRTIKSYLAKWYNRIGTEAKRSGDRQKLMTEYSPAHSFERPKFAGSLLSIDDRNPPFEYEKGKRMWFYNGIDLASEAFTCFVWGKTKEELIINFYRQLVRNYHEWGFNLPDGLECESSLNSSFKDTFLREGSMFQDVRIIPNKARSKKIERYFGELRYGIEKERMGWIARPFAQSESNQAGPGKKTYIPYPQLVNNCLEDLMTWNNMPHSIDKKITRWDYFCANQHENLKPTNYRSIIPQLGFKTKTSVHAGIINLQEKKFILGDHDTIYTGEKLIRLMREVEGKDVDIYWLDDNQGGVFKAYIFIGNQMICQALAKPTPNRARIERTPEQEEQFALFAKYAMTIDAYQRDQKNALEPVAVINQKPKTLNNNFTIPQLKNRPSTPKPKHDQPVEVMADDDDDFNYAPKDNSAGGWKNAFN